MDPIRPGGSVRRRGTCGVLAGVIGLAAALVSAAAEPAAPPPGTGASGAAESKAVRALHFDVFLDERPIGFQRFELAPSADGLTVLTRARFELTLLRIKALDYDHHNRERWRDGCLESIESRTRQNGKDYRVTGHAGAEGFTVEGREGRQRLSACVGTFSYWDKTQLLRQSKLLNSQTGEYLAVEIRALGSGSLRIGERDVAVDRYRIEGEDLEITLAYTRDQSEWVALDSPLFAGRALRYRRRSADLVPEIDAIPAPTPTAERAASPPAASP